MAPQYKLYYFPVRGRGEVIRYIFHYTDTPYHEVIVSGEEWGSGLKQKMPMHCLPVLELSGGSQISQSLAIARFLATKVGLVSSNSFENAWGEQLAGAIEDIYPIHYATYVGVAMGGGDAGAKELALYDLQDKAFTPLFNMLENFLGDNKWFCGQEVHWSDLMIAEHVDRAETIFDMNVAQSHPRLAAHCERIHENPGLKKYVEKRQPTPMWIQVEVAMDGYKVEDKNIWHD